MIAVEKNRRLYHRASRFLGARDGATAVEFSLVLLPFLLLMAAIIQCAFILWASQNLDAMLDRAVRSLTTGKFQGANSGTTNTSDSLSKLRNEMCGSGGSKNPTVFKCADVKLNVAVASNFADGTSPSAYDPKTKSIRSGFESYACPAPGAITIVTAVIAIPTFFSGLLPIFSTLGDGSYLLTSTSVFRTEPYTTTAC